jgi:hypothetical protein
VRPVGHTRDSHIHILDMENIKETSSILKREELKIVLFVLFPSFLFLSSLFSNKKYRIFYTKSALLASRADMYHLTICKL